MKLPIKELRKLVKNSITEVGVSPAIFRDSKLLAAASSSDVDPFEKFPNIKNAFDMLKREYASSMKNVMLVANKDSYDAEKRDFSDEVHASIEKSVNDVCEKMFSELEANLKNSFFKASAGSSKKAAE